MRLAPKRLVHAPLVALQPKGYMHSRTISADSSSMHALTWRIRNTMTHHDAFEISLLRSILLYLEFTTHREG